MSDETERFSAGKIRIHKFYPSPVGAEVVYYENVNFRPELKNIEFLKAFFQKFGWIVNETSEVAVSGAPLVKLSVSPGKNSTKTFDEIRGLLEHDPVYREDFDLHYLKPVGSKQQTSD